ncbi:MAG: VOC family protein [Actinomycetota bacterium]|nr:VOC family protein [Actinomycetota bacterium]
MAIRGRRDASPWSVALDAPDAQQLSRFYLALLGWTLGSNDPEWVTIRPPDGAGYLAFQSNDSYVRPVWPAADGDQQLQLHLDVAVTDLDGAVQDAVALGAQQAAFQPQQDVRVMLDPAGHPFCLWLDERVN